MRDANPPDVLITTDMCDVAQLRGLMPRSWAAVKVVTMFHENQLTFPWSPDDPDRDNGRDNTYAYVNLSPPSLPMQCGSIPSTTWRSSWKREKRG